MTSIVTALTKASTKPVWHRPNGAQKPIEKHQNKGKDNNQRNSQTCWQFHTPAKPFNLHRARLAGKPACRGGSGKNDRKKNKKLLNHVLIQIQYLHYLTFKAGGK